MNRSQKLEIISTEKKQVTKESITHALFILLETTPIDKIKIVDLTKKAGVSRGSFYRHYSTVEEVLITSVQNNITDLKKILTKDLSKDWMIIIKEFRKQKKYFTTLIKNKYSILLLDTFNEQYYKNDYYHQGWNGFVFNILYTWIQNDMKETDEELYQIINQCTKKMSDAIINNSK